MKHVSRFAFRVALATALSLLLGVNMTFWDAVPAQAATTAPSWAWTDVSSVLPARTDRPVWALAYTASGFVGTDGQALSSGGRVWLTNGSKTTDLTAAAKTEGVTKVDAIVSDGSIAMLLTNPGSPSFHVVSYDGSEFRDRTGEIKAQLAPGEAIAAINGKNDDWIIVTTKGNVLEWQPALLSFVERPVFVSGVADHIPQAALTFTAPQNTSGNAPTTVLPLSYGWLIVLPSNEARPQSEYYFYQDGVTKEVSNLFTGLGTLTAYASNGSQAVLIGADRSSPSNMIGYTYDGLGVTGIDNMNALGLSRASWAGATMTWTGTTWVGYAGKTGFLISDGSLISTDKSRDKFVTVASDQNGTILFGGAASKLTSSQPNKPLTAKLARLSETQVAVVQNPTNVSTPAASSASQTSAWTWVEPNATTLAADQTTSYNIGAWSPSGIKRIEITANGVLQQYCDLGDAQGNQVCSVTINGADYAKVGVVALQGTVVDGTGATLTTSETDLAIGPNGTGAPAAAPSGQVSAWGWFDAQPYVASNGVVAFDSQAQAAAGLSRVEIDLNASPYKTCTYTNAPTDLQDCNTLVFGTNLAAGTYGVTVKAFDVNGAETDSQSYSLTYTAANTTGDEMNGVGVVSLSLNKAKYMPDDTTTYTLTAADPDGLDRIQILVNWQLATVCRESDTLSPASCSVTFEGYKYAGQDPVVISQVIDARGNVVWTGEKTLSFAASRDKTASAVSWISPNVTQLSQDQTATVGATAYAGTDIRRIDIYVNGAVSYTCTYAGGTNEKDCSTMLKGSDYAGNSNVTVQAMLTDAKGKVSWSTARSISVVTDTSGLWYGDQPSLLVWSTPGPDGKTTITANGQAPAGVQRIDILVNGSSVATCGNKTTCTWTGTFAATGATYSATMVDMDGRLTWSGYDQMAINK